METKSSASAKHYPEYQKLSMPELDKDILSFWQQHDIFNKSISTREGGPAFVFYEGPPSANGHPGIHHVMGRTIKDIFCRYKTLKGFQVHRKAGWDTHGLPIELNVEKELGISKDDIGTKISVEDYNKACRESVMRFTGEWNEVTEKMGYWVDLEHPYITYESNYIESCWWLLRQLFDKGLLYKGYTIQPFSPAAGTGLSSHELNQPGTYQKVKDTTIVAQFKVVRDAKSEALFQKAEGDLHFIAWTTTPWTLPSNTALAVGKGISYVQVNTNNPYTDAPVSLVLAEALMGKVLGMEGALTDGKGAGKVGGKKITFEVVGAHLGSELAGMRYEQLMPYVQPEGDAFRVIVGDFVTTEDGTGIVHIAPTFGADDFRVAAQNGIPSLLLTREDGSKEALVDKKGRFVPEMGPYAGLYVKNYNNADESAPDYKATDVLIAIQLKEENKAFKVEKYEHDYPHCWRTDKPILYYPLDAWFIKTTALKDRMVELNNTINWKPESTGTGRFGNWLENLVDWNLSRSRFWGIPLPVWANDDYSEIKCIGSRAELVAEMQKAVAAGFMTQAQAEEFAQRDDLHRPYVDYVVLVSETGKPMRRETDLIDACCTIALSFRKQGIV
jgi:isoleucyl-tRNA synthetase